jgi:hypothetical protein
LHKQKTVLTKMYVGTIKEVNEKVLETCVII